MKETKIRNKVLCGTGHRPQDLPGGYNYIWKKDIENIQKFILDNGITKIITGMALGFDQALAIAVIKLKNKGHKLHLKAAMPCKNQDNKWAIEYKKLYKYILERCDSKVIISEKYTQDCMQRRNRYMVDHADIVLAFHNGKRFGGTYNCIQYAKSVGKPVVNIFPMNNVKKETIVKHNREFKMDKKRIINLKMSVENKTLNKIYSNILLKLEYNKYLKFVKMYNVRDNRELKRTNSNVSLEIRTRDTEDLLDINGQIWRLNKNGYKAILQSPKGSLLSSRALGKYTRKHVNVEIGDLSEEAITAKLTSFKDMMSHMEYVEVPVYEMSYPSAFDHKIPETDEYSDVVVKTVEKTVYLDRTYTMSMDGVYCIDDKSINFGKLFASDKREEYIEYNEIRNNLPFIKSNNKMKKLAKSFKIPLASIICNEVIDPDDETYLLYDCKENVIELIKKKYETISPEKKKMLLKFFGIRSKNIHISDFENFSYAMINFKMFRVDGLPLPNKVDAKEFINMLEAFKVPNAYDIIYDLAEKGMLVHLEDYPELQHFEEVRFYEDSYIEDEDILD